MPPALASATPRKLSTTARASATDAEASAKIPQQSALRERLSRTSVPWFKVAQVRLVLGEHGHSVAFEGTLRYLGSYLNWKYFDYGCVISYMLSQTLGLR